MRPYLVVANWKMYFSYQEAVAWARTHLPTLAQILEDSQVSYVLCPSYEALSAVAQITENLPVLLGAQDCSPYDRGAYTGQVCARSLKEIGCTYAIVGHSEVRAYQRDQNNTILLKLAQLFEHAITPIICISEVTELTPLLPTLAQHQNKTVYVAYEPLSAIGSESMPTAENLTTVYAELAALCAKNNIQNASFMYGGNVNENTLQIIKNVPAVSGVLVGRASTDFQKIKTIVSLVQKDYSNTP